MKVIYFGSYQPTFSRNHILITGLRQNHVRVVHCQRSSPWFWLRYPQLIYQFLSKAHRCQAIIVGVTGHYDMPLAWLLGKIYRLPVIFDAFYSLYDTYIFDRQIASAHSLHARWWWLIDKTACTLADKIILDTPQHINYFIRTFRITRSKFIHIPAGADDTIFKPITKISSLKPKIYIEFHGMFTRLSGAEHFIQAAKSLEANPHLEFWLIGESAHYHYPLQLLRRHPTKNLRYWSKLPLKALATKVQAADITVGHLGKTNKAKRVISFKTYQGLASRNAVIISLSPASTTTFTPSEVMFVPPANPHQLAQKIIELASHPSLRQRLATAGYKRYKKYYTNQLLAQKLIAVIKHYE